jgi:hypothetical protein
MPPLMVPIVQLNELGALAVSAIFGLVALQIASVAPFVTEGVGFTVTVIVYGAPTQFPVVDVGVTIYCTVPAVALEGLVSVWLIVLPAPAVAPVMPPLMVPMVHVKLAGALDVRLMFVPVLLQIDVVAAFVTAGVGLTVTVMVNGAPVQLPVTDVGVTIYSTVPAVELEGLLSVWLIVVPDPAVAPEILPVTVPIVHANVLGALAVSAMFGLVPLQIAFVAAFVTAGVGLTVTVMLYGAPAQVPVVDVGVIMYCTVPGTALLGFVNVWLIEGPEPAVAPVIPPLMVPIVHANVAEALDVKVIFVLVALQIDAVAGFVTAGVGFTVTVIVYGAPTHPPVTDVGVTIYCTVPAMALLGLVSV